MAYMFRLKDKSVEKAVRRVALEEIDAALAEIDDPQMDLHTKVHEVRKHAKKLRGLIRLVRPAFPGYARENAAIRDAARRLSGLRDREGMIETFHKLMANSPDPDAETRFAPVLAFLEGGREDATAAPETLRDLAGFRAALVTIRNRATGWKIEQKGFGALADGLSQTWTRGRAAMKAFAEAPSDARVHEWRKRVKYHWYHARALSPIWPAPMDVQTEAAKELSEMLGDHHDLTVLQTHIRQAPSPPDAPEMWDAFDRMIEARRDDLQAQALALGGRLYAEPAEAMVSRWRSWWKLWRGTSG
ncbi:MAG: hypothetical protein CL814_17555 [Confluentimicrobium sp.]|jgi:CHAD domain-containing protein|uniref:CHAD domain-containing protein n=1 Tax=Actibacterium sp. TaxID=1872125 RepID=UPI000C43002E|nr:CHAD domain-containing protein [Actibacterium sp.]MBC58726.1 hypothetical protein [Actibacterium sp.]|tara:strand:+ start:2790 stop:3695 length:906 start_codon:yes stop_codon:yes gene_type:complete